MRQRRWAVRADRVTVLMLLVGIGILALGVTVRLIGFHVNTVLSNSMRPTFSAGDLVVTQTVPMDSIHIGDVIAFMQPGGSAPVIHRISSLQDGVITTRGDANSVDDPWHLTPAAPVAYRLVAVVPYAGWLTELQLPLFLVAGLLGGLALLLRLRKGVMAKRVSSGPQPEP